MSTRNPIVGGDRNMWGVVLNALLDHIRTREYDVRDYVSDTSGGADMRAELIAMLDVVPEGAEIHFPAGTHIKVSGYIPIAKRVRLFGMGRIDWTDNGVVDEGTSRAGIMLFADGSTVDGLWLTNENGIGPRRAIRAEANHITIRNCFIDNWDTGINQTFNNGEWRGFICENNIIINIFGRGWDVIGDSTGDGISVAGTDAIVRGNIVRGKAGTVLRCGIVQDGVPEQSSNPLTSHAVDITDHGCIIANNIVDGPFTRAYHVELAHGTILDSNQAYGFTWYGIVVWNATEITVSNNYVEFTSTAAISQGTIYAYANKRCGILGLGSTENKVRIAGNTIKLQGSHWNAAIALMPYGAAGSTSYIVENNIAEGAGGTAPRAAVYVESATGIHTVVRNNDFRGFEDGVSIVTSPTATVIVKDNTMEIGVAGVRSTSCDRLIVDGNVITGLNTTVTAGIFATAGALLLARTNTIIATNKGIVATGVTASYEMGTSFVGLTSTKLTGLTNAATWGPA